jgi:hypothetical protein
VKIDELTGDHMRGHAPIRVSHPVQVNSGKREPHAKVTEERNDPPLPTFAFFATIA